MSNYLFPKLTLAVLFLTVTFPALSQVVPAASDGGGIPLSVGVGLSDYDLDWGHGRRMVGISAWADWNLYHMPRLLRGLGIEAEGHAIDFARPSSLPNMRQDTALGGVTYTWRHFNKFDPYAKFVGGIGSIDFPSHNPHYHHDTFSVFAPGGGVEYRIWRHISVRGDYEYQFWTHFFGPNSLTPQGFTVGATYNFRRIYTQPN